MYMSNNIEVLDLCLKIGSTLIIADVHMGFEEALNKKGVLVPVLQYKDTVARLLPILRKSKPERIVINGDLKHEFGMIMDSEWRNTIKLLDFMLEHCDEVVLLRGNHDTMLGPIARKKNIKVLDYLVVDGSYLCHGHEIPCDDDFKQAKRIIIGHEHPAVMLRHGSRSEIFKCFLKGKYKKKELIVMPSFNVMLEGSDILKGNILTPFLRKNIDDFEVFLVGEHPYDFGKVADLREGF